MNATATAYAAGDVIKGRPVKNGRPEASRRGVVLGLYGTDSSAGYLVWWYGKGPADMTTVGLMFGRELAPAGTLTDLTEAVLSRIEKGARRFSDAQQIYMTAGSLRARKRAARLA